MESGQKDIEELPTMRVHLKLGTILFQICLVLEIFMVPSDHISQKVGSEKLKSNDFRKKHYSIKINIETAMLVISISSDYICSHQKIVENINGRTIFVIVVVGLWASFNHIYDRQNVLASNISTNRPIWTRISEMEK